MLTTQVAAQAVASQPPHFLMSHFRLFWLGYIHWQLEELLARKQRGRSRSCSAEASTERYHNQAGRGSGMHAMPGPRLPAPGPAQLPAVPSYCSDLAAGMYTLL